MNQISTLSEFQRAQVGDDPSTLGWPATLPVEIALKVAPMSRIREEYGYTVEEWSALKTNPEFLVDLKAAMDMVRKEGMSFKLKARLQADELLKQSWKMIHASHLEVPASVKADLLKATMRWAGYDNKDVAAGAAGGGNALNIQINLG